MAGSGLPLLKTQQISAEELHRNSRTGRCGWPIFSMCVERGNGRQDISPRSGAARWMRSLKECRRLSKDRPVAVHCKSGYRSMIACSLLERAGHRNVLNVAGGFDAWHAAQLPEVSSNSPRSDAHYFLRMRNHIRTFS